MKLFLALVFLLTTLSAACERVKEWEAPAQGLNTLGMPLSSEKQELKETPPEAGAASSLNVANIVLQPKAGAPIILTIEIARSAEEKRQGLQGRENLPDKHGMWFIFDQDVQEPFWMKDTPIPLDIVFVDRGYRIVDMIVNAAPNSELLLVPKQKYRYALELKGGSAAAFKLSVGDRVEYRLGPP